MAQLLKVDGTVVAFGDNEAAQCDIPAMDPYWDSGVTFVQVSAGRYHTVLLKSNGRAVA